MAQLSTTETDHEQIYENMPTMGSVETPVIEALPPADVDIPVNEYLYPADVNSSLIEYLAPANIYTPVIESLSPADDSEVRRIRKFLLIILSICLVISAISLIALPILWMAILPEKTITPQAAQIGQLLMSILFYNIGIFIAYRCHQTGLRVFGWLCRICLILLGIAIIFFLFSLVIALITMKVTDDDNAALATSAVAFIILIMLCVTAFITTLIIVKFTFKLATLIDSNERSTTEKV